VAPESGVAVAGKYLQAGHTLSVQTPGKDDGVWVLAKNCSERDQTSISRTTALIIVAANDSWKQKCGCERWRVTFACLEV